MSKTHTRRNPNLVAVNDAADRAADAADAKLRERNHEFGTNDGERTSDAPVGLAPSSPRQVSGATVFDVIPNLSSVGQITVLRAIANGALIASVFAAHDMLVTEDEERAEAARLRMAQQAELASHAALELGTLAQNAFDKPMTLDEALDFAATTAAERKPEDLPAEVLEALGITAEQLKLIDATEQQKAAQRSAKLRESIRELREDIRTEVASFIGTDSSEIVNQLTADQHQALLRKAVQKSQARMQQLIGSRARYSGALGEAMLLAGDIKTLDKALVDFTRANAGELRDAA